MNDKLPLLVNFDPVAVSLGPVQIHWYGIMYLLGFATFWWLGRQRAGRFGWTHEQVDDFLFWAAIGVIVGGRLGYVLFYDFANVVAEPIRAIQIWKGGMSFHGGLLGVIVAAWVWGRKQGWGFFRVSDFIAPMVPPGLFFGRFGNFIGGELWGRLTDHPIGVIFPKSIPTHIAPFAADDPRMQTLYESGMLNAYARHPSQLYEALLEGIILFVVLWIYSLKSRPTMAISGVFLLGYGLARFSVEFFREPDADKGFIALDWITMGMALSMPMIVIGAALIVSAYVRGSGAESGKALTEENR